MDFLSCFDFNRRTSLYIHVPFCTSKCDYCAFFSKPCKDEALKESFTAKLIREIEEVAKVSQRPFYTVFIGGGNPGCLSVEQLERICKAVCTNGSPFEFTTEMNPESLKNEHFPLFEKYFTRLSMGVQSLNQKALDFLGRNTSEEDTLKGIELSQQLRDSYHISLNYDLITCLGTWHDALKDVKEVVERYRPDHLSVYALTLEEGTALFKKNPTIPNSDEQYEILQNIWQYLEHCGYEHYEVSNFAKSGRKSYHNCVYWDYEQYVGLGPGSASTGFVSGKVFRCEYAKSTEQYANSPLFGCCAITSLTNQEALEEFVLMGLRHKDGLNLERLKYAFGKQIYSVPDGFTVSCKRLCPSDEGLMIADAAALQVLENLS